MRIPNFFMGAVAAIGMAMPFIGCSGTEEVDAAQIIEPLPQEFPLEEIHKDAVMVRLSDPLFTTINTRWKEMVQRLILGTSSILDVPELSGAYFNEGGELVIPVKIPCQEVPSDDFTVIICDSDENGKCDLDAEGNPEEYCDIAVIGRTVEVSPKYDNTTGRQYASAVVKGALDTNYSVTSGSSGKAASRKDHSFKLYLKYGTISTSCSLKYDVAKTVEVTGGLELSLDSTEPNPIHFELMGNEDGKYLAIKVGDKSGLISVLDAADVSCSGVLGGIAAGLLKGSIGQSLINRFEPEIQTLVKGLVDKASGQPCSWGTEDEKDLKSGYCRSGQTCECFGNESTIGTECESRGDYRCWDTDGKHFVSLYPGYDGRLHVGQFLESMGADPSAAFDFSALVGGSLRLRSSGNDEETGVATGNATLGAVLGLKSFPEENSYCVPPMSQPVPLTVTSAPDFKNEAPSGHQVGLAISEYTLNNAFYQATRSGLLCLSFGSELSSMISSALFSGFTPSLALLGDDLPMSIALRPTKAPYVTFGGNQVSGGKIGDPLVTVQFDEVNADFYAMVEERMVRLFTLNVNISAPVALEVSVEEETGRTMIHPVMGSLTKMISFNEIDYNSELLTEDIQQLGVDIGGLLSLADTIVSGILGTYPLPDIMGLRLSVDGVNGMGKSQEGTMPYLGAFMSVSVTDEDYEGGEIITW